MRELRTLEVDKWVPNDKPGLVKHAGMISPQEAFDALKKHLESVGLLPDEYFLSGLWRYENVSQLPDYRQANCCVNWGGSEGIYLDISLVYSENNEIKYFNFATGKTLGETGDDFLRMSRIAAECSMMLNGRGSIVRFHENEKEKNPALEQGANQLEALIQAAQDKQSKGVFDVAQYLDGIKGSQADEFKIKYGIRPEEILSDSSLLSRVAAEKQRLVEEYPDLFEKDYEDLIPTALYNICLRRQELLHQKRYDELKNTRALSDVKEER